jgi:hypothetical protein
VAFADDFENDRVDSANEMNETPLSNVDPMPVEEVDDEADWGRLGNYSNETDS